MGVLISYHNAYLYYIANIKSYQLKTKYNTIAINMQVWINMPNKKVQKLELDYNFNKIYIQIK